MAGLDDIRREAEGRPAYVPAPGREKRPRRDPKPRGNPGFQPSKTRLPTASPNSSEVAQAWYDRANRAGMELPYDVNFLALAIQAKVEKDPEIQPYLQAGRQDQVLRWLLRMTKNFWDEYVDNTVTQRNVKDYFLDDAWDDVRDYAKSNLRADYLKAHGKTVEPPAYLYQQEFEWRLDQLRIQQRLEEIDLDAEPALDTGARERLRSWRQNRRRGENK